ncbi:cytochrome P450 78A5-like [Pyrus x bretschneideri]|uniref:cytochrome P450 78A5-like n=1 Tax=Pyrus x bretschneideri TaxID=225117 RepID=UPI00202E98A9|nr:cytochrome P450 78A5-like [Pyrus x bretschneideri]
MSVENHLLFIPRSVLHSSVLGFEAFACFLLLTAVCAFCLSPGGFAWALCKVRAFRAIPGPTGYPFIGSLTVFTGLTRHRVLAKMAKSFKAESLMSFSVGLTRFVIASHPETAKEMLNSTAFANRPVNETAYELLFHRAMGFAPYGDYWRNLRRIAATHLFSPKRVVGSEVFRREIGMKMVEELKRLMTENGEVHVKRVLHFGSLNNVMMTVFGRCYEFDKGGDGLELEGLVTEGYELLGVFNWSNHFPFLGWLDLQGVRKRSRNLVLKVNVFVGKIIEEHRLERVKGDNFEKEKVGDFVDVLLDLEEDDKLSDSDMIAVLWEMIFRGTDTVAILLEWILARMVLHPEIQSKAQSEIDAVVGSTRTVQGSDIPNLPYLQAIVKECLRVHPPGPLLSWARIAIHDVYVGDNFVPAGTSAMVNMWAITHDDKVWTEPEKFSPERFMAEDVSIMGTDLRLAPFGSGRRVCPGKALGLATVQLWLAQLLQNFTWVASENCDVDLSECLKLSMEMKSPLVCKVVPRLV